MSTNSTTFIVERHHFTIIGADKIVAKKGLIRVLENIQLTSDKEFFNQSTKVVIFLAIEEQVFV